MPALIRSSVLRPVRILSSNEINPVDLATPVMAEMVEVFPAPLGPSKVTH